MSEQTEVENEQTTIDSEPDVDATIQVKGVTKRFGARIAVDNLSFDVKRGEIVGFLGPNGSGKTTTMRMLTSFYTPDLGTININGMDTQESDIDTRAAIGYLPENNPLYEDMLVSEYLAFVAEIRGLSPDERRRNLDITVEETGIQEYYYRPIHELSKGYHQRVGLAQAILHRPSVLILDEPTEGLDPNQRVTIRDLIRRLGGERTVLLSSHVMQEVENTCERVLIINRGRLVADNPDLRQLQSIEIEVRGRNVEAGLARIQDIIDVESLGVEDGVKRYSLGIAKGADPRDDIFMAAKSNDWEIRELHGVRRGLGDLFRDLTAAAESARDE